MKKEIARLLVGVIILLSFIFVPYYISFAVEYMNGDFVFDESIIQYEIEFIRWFTGLGSIILLGAIIFIARTIGSWIIKND